MGLLVLYGGYEMCSIFKYNSCVGRNFDYEVSYKEELRIIEKWENPFAKKYDVIGMVTGYSKYPLLYDGMNSNGLVCGGLAFQGNAVYVHSDANDKLHIPSYDFTLRILSECGSVNEAKAFLKYVHITDESYKDFSNSDLHWFIADEKGSIIVEQTKDGLQYYDGSVMTNNPPYPHMIGTYNALENNIGTDLQFSKDSYSRGRASFGLMGGYTSCERFERLSWLKRKLEQSNNSFDNVSQAFHLCSSVEQVYGATPVDDKYEYTIYSVVYDMMNKRVYLKGYDKLGVMVNNL